MTQEEKDLLLKDLCGRLPYGVMVYTDYDAIDCPLLLKELSYDGEYYSVGGYYTLIRGIIFNNHPCKPYLRPMSSMTDEEKDELLNLLFDKEAKHFYIDEEGLIDGKTSYLMKEGLNYPAFCPINIKLYTDFLLSHHFDYNGLIEKGLALVTPEGMPYVKL
jgi:hypothetical protein